MRRGIKAGIVGGVFAAMVGGAGYGVVTIAGAWGGSGGGPAAAATGAPGRDEVRGAAAEFFGAWERGDSVTAASFTNDDAAAEPVLASFGGEAHLTDVRITPGKARGTVVPFTVRARVSHGRVSKPFTYRSSLTVVRGVNSGRALVDWEPEVVHPELREGDTLVTEESADPPVEAVDRDGGVLTRERHPSLGPVLEELRARYGDRAGGEPGVVLVVRHAAGDEPDTPLLTLVEGEPGRLRTTISARVQAAAEKAVRGHAESSVVAVKPSTGEVLAVANHRADGFNAAFQGQTAPGSVMKIVTAAMLIDNDVTSMNEPAPCPDTATWQSQTFRNLTGLRADGDATLAESFLRSCNTAFVKLVDAAPLNDASLTAEAEERFGLGRDDWTTGIASFDGRVPASGGPDRAANAIGQGQVQMSPLAMASVTATAITGTFRQPYLVPPRLDGRRLATAEGLRASTAAQLKQMMRLTATRGTAAEAMAGLGGDIGAKTGSAEVDGQTAADGWFTGFRGDVAAAAMAERGGRGGDAAGPVVRAVLEAAGG